MGNNQTQIGDTLQEPEKRLKAFLRPWHEAVKDPTKAQEEVLHYLLGIYAQTGYGTRHSASQIESMTDYRRAFPVTTYENYKPLIQRVMAGETNLLLNEEPVGWAITRGNNQR